MVGEKMMLGAEDVGAKKATARLYPPLAYTHRSLIKYVTTK
jgi:hypothetical protein